MKPIHLLVAMSGQGTRYRKAGYSDPKPLIQVGGISMIERLLEQFPQAWPTHFVMAENHRDTKLPETLQRLRSKGRQSYVEVHAEGPGKAIEKGLEGIPDGDPVLVSYCDYGMSFDASRFEAFVRSSGCDACLVSYRGFHAHYLSPQKYAYSRLDGERVVEVREKGSFTEDRENEYASCGAYYFKSAKLLREALAFQRKQSLILNGESYTSLTTQAVIEMKSDSDVRVFEIPFFYQWGTPEDLRNFEYWERTFHAWNRHGRKAGKVDQFLMPMAGLGSRFGGVTPAPKPLISVMGEPMFLAATRSLPVAAHTVYVALEGFGSKIQEAAPGAKVVQLSKTPEGQALSTEAGVSSLLAGKDVIVSSTDHAVVMDPALWAEFRAKPDCDAAIFTLKGFPGTDRRPNAYAYVVAGSNDRVPLVKQVSVKKPVSDQPSNDALLVGTFWFKDASVLQRGIDLLKRKDVRDASARVNGELYLDSVFELLMQEGLRVRSFPLEGYINWGDPDSLAEALYWYEVFVGRRVDRRDRFPGGLN